MRPMTKSIMTPVRLNPEDRELAERKQEAYGLEYLSDVIRLGIRKLPMPRTKTP